GGFEIAGLVAGFAQEVMRVPDLARLASVVQSLLAEVARLLVVLEIEIAVAEIDVRVGEAARDLDRLEDALDHPDAFARLADLQLGAPEVLVKHRAGGALLLVEHLEQRERLLVAFAGLLEV